ncbi:LysR family transcriptional regulator [Brenneria izadpanahii]|uniref:LysR family transcriptional regulator n=1 Tax=Brenneria izadpanahii TaxID=2722756 RepID=A0ABX7UQJ3_9GAMM|nr:LysR family transcriptional regulator [Brenneria izadpanahii]QTF07869.1 LysR family transcriptional regulator [Brenneria izadpanahii]
MGRQKGLGQVTDFDLKLLRVFKTVAECGSFSSAESLLGITRSAISLHMSNLEKRLGMRLCQRGRAGFALTDEGREILRISESLLTSIETFRQQVNQLHKQLRGEFNIGIINNLITQPRMLISNALTVLRGQGMDVRINLSMSTPSEIERGLIEGRLHVGALPLISPLPSLNYIEIYEERTNLYCGRGHALFDKTEPISIGQLNATEAVAPSYRMTAEEISLHRMINCCATASDREGIAFLILTGKFVGFLPDHYANIWVERGMMRAIETDRLFYSSKIAIVTRKGTQPNMILKLFLSALGIEK